jgi:hypothetical protein
MKHTIHEDIEPVIDYRMQDMNILESFGSLYYYETSWCGSDRHGCMS